MLQHSEGEWREAALRLHHTLVAHLDVRSAAVPRGQDGHGVSLGKRGHHRLREGARPGQSGLDVESHHSR